MMTDFESRLSRRDFAWESMKVVGKTVLAVSSRSLLMNVLLNACANLPELPPVVPTPTSALDDKTSTPTPRPLATPISTPNREPTLIPTPTATPRTYLTYLYEQDYLTVPDDSWWIDPNWRPSFPEEHDPYMEPLYFEGSLDNPGPLQAIEEVFSRRFPHLARLGIVAKEKRISRNPAADVYSAGHCADNVLLGISRRQPSQRVLKIKDVTINYNVRQGLGIAEMAPIVPGRIQEGDAGFRKLFLDYSQTPKENREPFGAKMKVDSSGLWYRTGIGISRRPIEGEFHLLLADNFSRIFDAPISRIEYLFHKVKGNERRNPNLDLGMDNEPLRSIYREIYFS